jgi:hypothetical protein
MNRALLFELFVGRPASKEGEHDIVLTEDMVIGLVRELWECRQQCRVYGISGSSTSILNGTGTDILCIFTLLYLPCSIVFGPFFRNYICAPSILKPGRRIEETSI